jgi:5-methylcytosine-specific restriction endonuclease McrBC regulatory subunit McrC
MKQIIVRMLVALTMCAVTSVIRLTSFLVTARTQQIHAESIWILRIIMASVLSPLLYGFLDRLTSTWTIRPKHQQSKNSLNLLSHRR